MNTMATKLNAERSPLDQCDQIGRFIGSYDQIFSDSPI